MGKQVKNNNTNLKNPTSDPNLFLKNSGNNKKNVGDVLKTSVNPVKGFKNTGETRFMDTSEFSDYTQNVDRGSFAFPFQSDYTKSRAINQSNWEQTGRTIGKLLPKTALEFMGQVGNVLDFEDYFNSDNEVGNWLNTWAQEKKAEVEQFAPVYRETPDKALDVSDPAWWMQSGSSLVESATAFVGLGYLTGAASLKILNSGGKALEWLGAISKGASKTNTAKKAINTGAGLTSTLALNQAEGVGIATNVYNESYIKEKQKLEGEENGLSSGEIDIQAKQIASEKAASVVDFNRINILLNLTSAFALLKVPALTRQARKAVSLKKSAKVMGIESSQEAVEETINLIAEKQADRSNYSFEDAYRDVATREGAESAILGFVGGGGQTALTNAGRTLKINRDESGQKFSRNDRQNADFSKQQESKLKIESMNKAEKISDVTDAYLKAEETYALYTELQKATKEGDSSKVQQISNRLLSVQAYDAFVNGTTDQLINVFKGIKTLSKEEAELKGLDKNTYIENTDKAIKQVENLEKEFNKASTYLNFNEVYDNRAKNLGLKNSKKELEGILETERTDLIEDLGDLGIKEDAIEFNENGRLTFTNFKRYGDKKKTSLNELESLKAYKETRDSINKVSTNIKNLSERHAVLTSDEEQDKIKANIKLNRKQKLKEKAEEKLTKKQNKETAEAKKVQDSFKEEVKSTEQKVEVKTEVEEVVEEGIEETSIDIDTPIKPTSLTEDSEAPSEPILVFSFPHDKNTEVLSNKLYNDPLKSTDEKIKIFKDLINRMKPHISTEGIAGMVAQLNVAIRELEATESVNREETEVKDSITNKSKEALNDALEDLDDFAPKLQEEGLNEEEQKLIRQKRKVNDALDLMAKANIDINNFNTVAKFAQNSYGISKFLRVFDTFKALYNLIQTDNQTSLTYGDIFYDYDTKKNIIKSKDIVDINKAFAEVYSISDLTFGIEENKVLKEYIENQSYTINKNEKVTEESIKIQEGFNKLAHLDKKTKRVIKTSLTGTFNVLDFVTSKTDLDNELNDNVSDIVLNPDLFNVGSEITFVVLDEVVYDNGTIAYADGRIETNGEVTKNNPIDTAPIGVIYDGELLKGQFLHTTEWINENNIADFTTIQEQKDKLYKIRKEVIDSPTGITTVITDRSNGHFMRDVNGVTNTVLNNLPNAEIAIGKDGKLFNGENTTIETKNSNVKDAMLYVVLPVNKDTKFGVPIQRDSLSKHPLYVASILNSVELYLNNNKEDERAKTLLNELNIDITTIKGLKTYLETFLFLNPKLDESSFKFDKFKNYVEHNIKEDSSVIRIVYDPNNPKIANIEFGRGANVGDTIRFINRDIISKLSNEERNKTVQALLSKFENVLNNNTRINIAKDKFNTSFQLPLINTYDVSITEIPYNDFVKQHSTTDLYSYTLESGKEIYTVQPNLQFDTAFALTTIEEIPSTVKEEFEDVFKEEEETGFDPFEDIDAIEDLSPRLDSPYKFNRFKEETVTVRQAKRITRHLSDKYGIESVVVSQGLAAPYGEYNTMLNRIYINADTTINKEGDLTAALKPTGYVPRRTIFHEYLHPFVEILEKENPSLYDELYIKAKEENLNSQFATVSHYPKSLQKEELVVRYLDRHSVNDKIPTLVERFFNWLSSLFYKDRKNNKQTLQKLSKDTTVTELYEVFKNYGNIGEEVIKVTEEKELKRKIKNLNSIINNPDIEEKIKENFRKELEELTSRKDTIDYTLKATTILKTAKAKDVFNKGKNNNWDINKILTELQIPKEQKTIIIDSNLTDLSSILNYLNNFKQPISIKEIESAPFSTFVAKGGENYKVQAIQSPSIDILPKGKHGNELDFIDKNTLGWIRTDNVEGDTSIKRVLEIQSDLFQNFRGIKRLTQDDNKNEFLKILNTNNNWIKFFINTSIDAAIKENRKKIRFPLKETVTEIQQQETVTEIIKALKSNIETLESRFKELDSNIEQGKTTVEWDDTGRSLQEIKTVYTNTYNSKVTELANLEKTPVNTNTITVEQYENIANIIRKKYKTEEVKDKYNNTWIEVTLSENIINSAPSVINLYRQVYKNLTVIEDLTPETSIRIVNIDSIIKETESDTGLKNALQEIKDKGRNNDNIDIIKVERHPFNDGRLVIVDGWHRLAKATLDNKKSIQVKFIDANVNLNAPIDLAPKTLTKQEQQDFEDTIPENLFIQGININLQEIIVNHITSNILKGVERNVKEGTKEEVLEEIDRFYNTELINRINTLNNYLNKELTKEQRERVEKNLEIAESIREEYVKITFLVLDNLQQYHNIIVDSKRINEIKEELEDESFDEQPFDLLTENGELVEYNNWDSDSSFRKDFKDDLDQEFKNVFSYIEDVKGFKIVGGKKIAIPKIVWGLPVTVPLDQVLNDLSGILAYSNYKNTSDNVTVSTIDSMIKTIEEQVNVKPYLHNVLLTLENASDEIKNKFIKAMSKSYTHHMYVYKNKKGSLSVNSSDNNNITNTIQNNWLSNIYNSPLINITEGVFLVNSKEVENITREAKELIVLLKTPNISKEVTTKAIKSLLDNLGLKFNTKVLKELVTKGVFYNQKRFSILRLLTESDGALKLYINRLNAIKGLDISENHPFGNNTALSKFARQISKLNTTYFANSFNDVRGRTYYGYSLNKFITDRTRILKTNANGILDKLSKQPFTYTSHWVKQFKINPTFREHFGYFTVDGERKEGTKGKKLQHMSPAEIEETKLGLFYSQNKQGKTYILNLLYPTTSDKSVSYGLKVLGHNWNNTINDKEEISPKKLEWLFEQLVVPEVQRILTLQDTPNRWDIKGYKEGGTMFNILPSLNAVSELWIKEGGTRKLNPSILEKGELRESAKKELSSFINLLVNDKLSTWEEFGFINEEKETIWDTKLNKQVDIIKRNLKYAPENSAKSEASNYVINYLVANMNIYQTFITDPAFYWKSKHWKTVIENKNTELGIDMETREEALEHYTSYDWIQEHEDLFNNLGKRLGADGATGTDLPNSPDDSFTLGIIADSERPAYLIDYYRALLGVDAKDYMNINSTDAQEFTTLKEHLHILRLEGTITKELEEELLSKDDNNIEIEEEHLKVIIQPMKPVYVNNIWNDGVEHRLYIKSSAFPLFKQLTKGLEIDKLRIEMVNKGIDRIAFESAVKIGGTANPTQVFESPEKDANNTGKVKTNIDINIIPSIPREGWKIQQEMPYSETKTTINDGTQQRKLLTASFRDLEAFKLTPTSVNLVTGKIIQEELDKKYNELFKLGYDSLIKELDFNIDTGTIDMKKLQKVLLDEALSRKYPLYDIEALKIQENEFVVPLWLTGVSGKMEAMLNSIVDNRVRKITPKGKSYILGTSEGFKAIEGANATNFMNTTEGIIYDKSWYNRGDRQLLPMRIEDAEGNLLGTEGFNKDTAKVLPAEVLLPFRFMGKKGQLDIKDFTDENNFIDFTKIDSKLLELFGFRIPTQGVNSMSSIKIVGFLPKRSGDLLLAPADWVIQMGSDFDIDKLFTNSYNTTYKDGKLLAYNEENISKQLENDILDLHFSILNSSNAKVQAEILKPLDFGKLPKLIEEIYPYTSSIIQGISISEQYQTYKYLNARAAKSGIGVFSTDSTFLASVQGKGIALQTYTKKGWIPYTFSLGGNKSVSLSNPNTNKGRTKFEVNSAIQSLAVDNENEQGMHKLNINKYTFDTIRTLVASGFEENTIFYFLNQPIILRYIELKIKAEDTVTGYKESQIEIDLFKEFNLTKVNADLSLYSNPSNAEMLDMIQNPISASTETQRALYATFLSMTYYGKKIQSVQSAINTDSSGLGKDLFYSTVKEEQVLELPYNDTIKGAERLIGDYVTLYDGQGSNEVDPKIAGLESKLYDLINEWFNGNVTIERKKEIVKEFTDSGFVAITGTEKGGVIKDTIPLIRPTTINGFASIYGLLLNNSLWGETGLFPYNLNSIINVTESIKNITKSKGDSVQESAENSKRIFSNIKGFLATAVSNTYTEGEVFSERERLLVDTENNMSIASIVKDLVDNRKLSNAFINRLQSDIKEKILPSNITYSASITENKNERPIYAALSQMLTDNATELGEYNGIQYTPKKVAQDLIAHQLLTGGVQKAKQFIKYIPINYLKAIGYYKGIKHIDLLDANEFNPISFTTQYIQHNPKEVELENKVNLKSNYIFTNKGTSIVKKIQAADELPNIFSIPDIKASSNYRLYKKDSVSGTWKQLDTLGYTGIMEYDATSIIAKSVLPLNQVPVINEVTLPKNEQDIKSILTIHNTVSSDPQVIYDPTTTDINEFYDLKSNQTSLNKFKFILSKISSTSDNQYNAFLAQELHNNIDKLKDYRFIIDSALRAKGSHNIKDKTIKINPKELSNIKDFENVILEEVIHAFTKEALLKNDTGEVARIKALRVQAKSVVMNYLKVTEKDFEALQDKIIKGEALTTTEAELLYPVSNDVEFVGRLFKSKRLQELLNDTPSDIKGKSILEKFWDIISNLLKSIGINVNKGSALEYATIDILSLINRPPPSSSIKKEMQKKEKVIRTIDFIYDRFNLKNEDGTLRELKVSEAEEAVSWIKDNITNLTAHIIGNSVIIENVEDFAPSEQGRSVPLLKSISNRIEQLNINIEKAENRKDFAKAEELKDVLQSLIDRKEGNIEGTVSIMAIGTLAEIAVKGQQDMQEVAEMLKRKVTLEDTLYIRKVIHFWKTAKSDKVGMFEEDDYKSTVLVNMFSEIENEAKIHEDTLTVIENQYMENLIKKYGNAVTIEHIFEHFQDINGGQRDYLDISRSNNPMLDSIFISVKDANIDALNETKDIVSELTILEDKVRPILKSINSKEPYEIFRQKTIDGKLTGHLVNRYTVQFAKGRRNVKKSLKDNNNFTNYFKVLQWAKKNTKDIKLDYLFPINELNAEDKLKADDYKNQLKEELGEQHYNDFILEQFKLIEKYENFKKGKIEHLADKYNTIVEEVSTNSTAVKEFNNWLLVNSPYVYYKDIHKTNYSNITDFKNFNSPSFIYQIPKDAKHYDKNFETIEDNQDLLDFYNYYVKVDKELKSYMPKSSRAQLAFNGIPFIEKTLLEEYKDKGMKIGLAPIFDNMKKQSRINMEGTISNKFTDPVTEIEERRLGLNLTANTSEEYFAYINTKTIEHELKYNTAPSLVQIETWGEEITDRLAQQKSYDLPKVLRIYALTVLAYKHKAKIEDNVKLAQNILQAQQEIERNSKGEILTDGQRRLEPKSPSTSFINTKEQLDYFIQVFYGKAKQNEGVTNKKVYTKEEKQRIKNYEGILKDLEHERSLNNLTEDEYDRNRSIIQAQINEIGGVAVWSKRGDGILKYVQLKSMGWNLMSSIANIGFGFIANRIEAAGGNLYTSEQLSKAYRLTWNSLLKNWTFNKVETSDAKKIRSLMDNWDVLKDATHELFQNPLNIELSKKGKWLAPYNLTQRTEYMNQAPVMIALMLNRTVKTDEGDISMWEGYDENGKWKSKYGDEPIKTMKTLRHTIDQVNKMNHGNYDGNSPLKAKNKFMGRALSQFRTWMFEGVATRFENEKEDVLLGTRKGRYISVITYFKAVGMRKASIDSIKGILKNASFGVMFKGHNFEEEVEGKSLKEIDAINMRKVMMEMVLLTGIYTTYLVLSTIGGNLDDEEDRKKKYALNILINQGIRLKTDIMFYLHPGEFRNLLRDLVPSASVVKDAFDFIDAVHRFSIGEDEISTGVYSGNSRLLRETAQALPLGTQVYKNINYSVQTFDK